MKWNKQSLIIVTIIFAISYVFSLKGDRDMSEKIKKQTLKSCTKQKMYDCALIEKFHDTCFTLSYRSQYKIKHFFDTEYDRCMKEKVLP